jgi:hypothetical protein
MVVVVRPAAMILETRPCWLFVLQGRFSSQEQFKVLHERYILVNNSTKGLLLSTYLKFLLSDPSNSGLQSDVIAVFKKCSHQMDPDLQQRGAEYLVSVVYSAHPNDDSVPTLICCAIASLFNCLGCR